jgi:hypothetical protein
MTWLRQGRARNAVRMPARPAHAMPPRCKSRPEPRRASKNYTGRAAHAPGGATRSGVRRPRERRQRRLRTTGYMAGPPWTHALTLRRPAIGYFDGHAPVDHLSMCGRPPGNGPNQGPRRSSRKRYPARPRLRSTRQHRRRAPRVAVEQCSPRCRTTVPMIGIRRLAPVYRWLLLNPILDGEVKIWLIDDKLDLWRGRDTDSRRDHCLH